MSRNPQKHIDAGIKQLVGHIIPKANRLEDREFVQETVDQHIELAHQILDKYVESVQVLRLLSLTAGPP